MQKEINRVGEIIRSNRLRSNLTIEGLASKIGISNRYLTYIENEGKIPKHDILRKIVITLSIDANHFFYDVISDNPKVIFVIKKLQNCTEDEIDVVIATLNALTNNKQFQ